MQIFYYMFVNINTRKNSATAKEVLLTQQQQNYNSHLLQWQNQNYSIKSTKYKINSSKKKSQLYDSHILNFSRSCSLKRQSHNSENKKKISLNLITIPMNKDIQIQQTIQQEAWLKIQTIIKKNFNSLPNSQINSERSKAQLSKRISNKNNSKLYQKRYDSYNYKVLGLNDRISQLNRVISRQVYLNMQNKLLKNK